MNRILFRLLVLLAFSPLIAHAQKTISSLPAASALGGSELLECVQGGNSRKCTATQIKTFTGTGGVSVSGTPSAGQATEWLNAATIGGVSVTGTGSYVKGTAPTITLPNATGLPVTGLDATGTPGATTYLRGDGTWATPAGSGDVTAAAAFATDNSCIRADGTGKGVKGSGINCTLDDTGNLSLAGTITAANLGEFTDPNVNIAVCWDDTAGDLKACTLTLSPAFPTTTIELGHATDTTLARSAAGVATLEGVTITRTIFSGTKALDTDAIASTACDTLTAVTATGTASTDTVVWTFNADVTAVTGYAPVTTGGLSIFVWPTTDTINIKVCNPTSSSITPGAVTINLKVLR